jgi:flavin reductase (DIM6/NTAB) family NADH-FMN oxidoreductase RutF
LIADSLAWVDCSVELVHDAGDHELIIGRVLDLGVREGEGVPLLFYRARFATVTAPTGAEDERAPTGAEDERE